MTNAFRRAWSALARVWAGRPLSQAPGVLFAGPESAAGVEVTVDSALSLSAVFAAVNLLSRVFGSLPRTVYQRYGRDKEPALTHPAYKLLHSSPNPEMTSSTYHRVMEWNRLLRGNAYAEVAWYGNLKPAALWPLDPRRVKPDRRESGELFFRVDHGSPDAREVEPEDLIHVPLVSEDGIVGRSFLDYAAESLGVGIATQNHAGAWFGNGARPGTILENVGNPSPEARREFKKGWDERHKGSKKYGGTAVLWGGWKWVGTDGQIDAEKSQLLQQRQFTVTEVARWLNIPPHLLADLLRATFSNIEQQGIDFLTYCFGPILADYEQEYDRKLLNPPTTYMKHNVNALMRGDKAARAAFYSTMTQIGVMSVNECRDLEDLNPVEGGDVHFVPLNMVPLSLAVQPPPPPAPNPEPGLPATPPPESGPAPTLTPDPKPALALLASTLDRLARVEINAVRRAAQKPGKFLQFLDEFYPQHTPRLSEALRVVLPACGVSSPAAPSVSGDWCQASHGALLDAADGPPGEFGARIEALLGSWGGRAAEVAAKILGEEPCEP